MPALTAAALLARQEYARKNPEDPQRRLIAERLGSLFGSNFFERQAIVLAYGQNDEDFRVNQGSYCSAVATRITRLCMADKEGGMITSTPLVAQTVDAVLAREFTKRIGLMEVSYSKNVKWPHRRLNMGPYRHGPLEKLAEQMGVPRRLRSADELGCAILAQTVGVGQSLTEIPKSPLDFETVVLPLAGAVIDAQTNAEQQAYSAAFNK